MNDNTESDGGMEKESGSDGSACAAEQLTSAQDAARDVSGPGSPGALQEAGQPQPGRPAIRLSALQIAFFVALGMVTVLLTWRTKGLEKLIANRTPVSALVQSLLPILR